ncbi:MAG: methyltransferase [Thermoprotei archaeon]
MRLWLKKNGFYADEFQPKLTEQGEVLLPVKHEFVMSNTFGLNVVRTKLFRSYSRPQPRLPFDIIGDICIFKEGKRGVRYTDEVRRLKSMYRFLTTFYLKIGVLEGTERIPPLKLLDGPDKSITIHVENGLKFYVDVKKTYFNPRLATERRRISELVTSGEHVLDLFAGVGPFSITIAKYSKAKVDAVDINPHSIALLKKNIELNRVVGLVKAYNSDAACFSPKNRYDRVLMNLPFNSIVYLEKAISLCKRNAIIHLYLAQSIDKKDYTQDIVKKLSSLGKVGNITKTRVLEYAARRLIERYDVALG